MMDMGLRLTYFVNAPRILTDNAEKPSIQENVEQQRTVVAGKAACQSAPTKRLIFKPIKL
jgi:hypothetical protein